MRRAHTSTTRGRRFPPEVLADHEVHALLAACGGPDPMAVRNRALIGLLYRSGLRITEALALHPKDVDLAAGCLRVLRAKGGRSRTVGLDAGAFALLGEWLLVRSRLPLTPTSPLFCTRFGGTVSSGYVRKLMPRLARAAGIAKRVHAHGLRHTHAAELRSEGLDIGIISKQLGHVSLLTTVRYLDHIAPTAVVQAIGRRAWSV